MTKVVINDVTVTLTDEQLKANGLQRIPELRPEDYKEWEPSPDGEWYYFICHRGQVHREKRRPHSDEVYQMRRIVGNVFRNEEEVRAAIVRQRAIVRIKKELRRLEFSDDGARNCTPSASIDGELAVMGSYMPSAFIKGFVSTSKAWQKVIETHEKDVRLVLEGCGA